MSRLARRVKALESRQSDWPICPEHESSPLTPQPLDYRAALAAFSPDPEERAAYLAAQERKANAPPCPRCGRQEFVVVVRPSATHKTT